MEILNWEIYLGGSRKGANVTVRDPQAHSREISGTVKGWMAYKDGCLEFCQRQKAEYVIIRRWSYGSNTRDIPQTFIVPLRVKP